MVNNAKLNSDFVTKLSFIGNCICLQSRIEYISHGINKIIKLEMHSYRIGDGIKAIYNESHQIRAFFSIRVQTDILNFIS